MVKHVLKLNAHASKMAHAAKSIAAVARNVPCGIKAALAMVNVGVANAHASRPGVSVTQIYAVAVKNPVTHAQI